jgi:hypothetical protein
LAGFVRAIMARELSDRSDILARANELGIDLDDGACVVVARAHSHVPDRGRLAPARLAVADRGHARRWRAGPSRALGERDDRPRAPSRPPPARRDDALAAGAPRRSLRELQAALPGHTFAIGRSRPVLGPERSPPRGQRGRCSPPTSPRATPSAPCWLSRRPVLTRLLLERD